jgi:hypothetical protein
MPITTREESDMSGYYPAGVTGNEYEIAGPQREWNGTRTVYCNNVNGCEDAYEDVDAEGYGESYEEQGWFTWTCSKCEKEQTTEFVVEAETREYEPEDYL